MNTITLGIRVDVERGVSFFGLEEVNRSIQAGARVVEIRPGGAIMRRAGDDDDAVTLTFSGCDVEVVLETPEG